jgi:hypothetical protein
MEYDKLEGRQFQSHVVATAQRQGPQTVPGPDAGGERAVAIYSLISSAKLNGLNPEAYLRNELERIADHPINRIEELLPWNLATELAPDSLHAA